MKGKKPKELENVKLNTTTVDLLRKHKQKTGIPISTFVEQAISEKFKKSKLT
jgi:post-segregation antitoxin (ccd killing protein)